MIMNILWVANIPLKEASLLMNEEPSPFGGWLINASNDLSNIDDIKLSIAFPKKGISDIKVLKGNKITYYAFPSYQINKKVDDDSLLSRIIDDAKPDIVHIYGTEYTHSLAFVELCIKNSIKHVISIQGLISIYAKHYMANLPCAVRKRFSFRDFIKQDNLYQQQKKFERRGHIEIETIKKARNIIGRTTWDKACTGQLNPKANYFFCNETLRGEFYKHTWDYQSCEKHSIFTSQASYPIKGLHYLLEAMPIILENYPDAKLYVAGNNITKSVSLKEKASITSYGLYIRKLIEENKLQENIVFTDVLGEEEMAMRHLKSNVFICPSSIENSPNSLGEAMIMGVPVIAADVGGVSDMMKHKDEGFVYQGDAPYMIAYYVCKIFEDSKLASQISKNARKKALLTHDIRKNTENLIRIYNIIVEEG